VPEFYWFEGASSVAATSSIRVPFSDGQAGWIRATRSNSGGPGGVYQVIFYTSSDGVTWTQLGTIVNGVSAANPTSTTNPVLIGAFSTASSQQVFVGSIYYVEIRNGINGTVVASPFLGVAVSVTDSAGNVWTLNSTGSSPAILAGRPATNVIYVSTATNTQASGTTISASRPANVRENDLLVAYVSSRASTPAVGQNITSPGWNLLTTYNRGGSGSEAILVRSATSNEKSSFTFTTNATTPSTMLVDISVFRGVAVANILFTNNTANATTPSVTTATPNNMIVRFASNANNTSVAVSATWPSSAEVADIQASLSTAVHGTTAAYKIQAAAGASGTETVTFTGTATACSSTIALPPLIRQDATGRQLRP